MSKPLPQRSFLANGGELGALILARDWSDTKLGPILDWPTSLRTTVDLVLSSPIAMTVLWGCDLIQLYNAEYAAIAGPLHPRALGQPTRECWPEVWQFNEPIYGAVMRGEARSFKDQLLTIERLGVPEEAWFDLAYSGLCDDAGVIAGVLVTVVETTRRVLAERNVATQAERLRQLFDQAPGWACIVTGPTHVFEFGNEAYARLIGRKDFVGKTLREALPDIEGQGFYEKIDSVYATGERFVAEHHPVQLIRAPGATSETRYVDFIYAPIIDEAGRITGVFAQGYDVTDAHLARQALLASDTRLRALNADLEQQITERRRVEEALRQSQKLEAMGQLTGGVAHDFNNLLTPIIGSLDILQRRGLGDERTRRLIDGAMQSAERAKTLVQRLLAFARRQPLQTIAVNLEELIAGMTELLVNACGPQTQIHLEIARDLPPIKIDPNQLEMAILNICVNARDAMPTGGELTISAVSETASANHHPTLSPGRYIRFSIADTGAGMDANTLARAVEPFFSTKGVGRGTGLGLSMVHGLATQLGGDMTIVSRPGYGATITLRLPVSREPVEAARRIVLTTKPHAIGSVLLVEDEELIRMTTADMLADIGYSVVEATSSEEALRTIERGAHFDVIISDHMMPGMTGTALARIVRKIRPGVPVLIISGYAEADGVAADLPRLTKPFRQAELKAMLAGLRSGAETAGQSAS